MQIRPMMNASSSLSWDFILGKLYVRTDSARIRHALHHALRVGVTMVTSSLLLHAQCKHLPMLIVSDVNLYTPTSKLDILYDVYIRMHGFRFLQEFDTM